MGPNNKSLSKSKQISFLNITVSKSTKGFYSFEDNQVNIIKALNSPLGSEGTSHITRAVVKETSGKDTLDGGPGTSSKVLTCIEGVLSFPEKNMQF